MTFQRKIILNGITLSLGHVGQGVYASRLVRLFLKILPPEQIRILYPASWPRPESAWPLGLWESVPAPYGLPLGQGLLGNLIWGLLLGAHARKHHPGEIFVSPGPFIGPLPERAIIVMHDVIYRHFPLYEGRWFVRKFLNRLAEWNAARAWKVVTVSQFSMQELVAWTRIRETQITVIPNWIEDAWIEAARTADLAAIRRKYDLPERFWLYLGGYDYRKNVEFLIEAYAQARREVECPPLVLAGKIPTDVSKPVCDVLGAILRQALRKEQVRLPGFIVDEDLPGLYRAADLFVFPSLMEGFGYTPAEALACGTPSLVADNSSLREVAPEEARRFDSGDLICLTNALKKQTDTDKAPSTLSEIFREAHALKLWEKLFTPEQKNNY